MAMGEITQAGQWLQMVSAMTPPVYVVEDSDAARRIPGACALSNASPSVTAACNTAS